MEYFDEIRELLDDLYVQIGIIDKSYADLSDRVVGAKGVSLLESIEGAVEAADTCLNELDYYYDELKNYIQALDEGN